MVFDGDKQEQWSVIQQVDFIIEKAIDHRASDIHFESTENGLRVRYRIDGVLYDQPPLSQTIMQQLLSRLKVMAHIDITERRVPQDGKFKIIRNGYEIDMRVSTFPALYGEKIVVRILDRTSNNIDLEQFGFSDAMLAAFKNMIRCSSGLFLVTGPTGSGKTTTLYGALATINSPEKNIITLEDPVEYSVDGITQGHINPNVGFTFEKGMRALLRQDPDVIMVGEIRDVQTARIAIEAALTGHVVFSTLHTNDAPGAIMRLMDMGIEPFLINAALIGVLAQRLVRTICNNCRIEQPITEQDRQLMERLDVHVPALFVGQGCERCLQSGYKGRTGIFELLQMTNDLRALIVKQPLFDTISMQARADGMITLRQDSERKLKSGIISLSELARVIF